MKNKKGFTLVELLICIAIVGIIAAIAIPNISTALKKAKKNGPHHESITVQEVVEKTKSERVSISEVGRTGDITYYIVKDLNTGIEYLVAKYSLSLGDEGGVSVTKMDHKGE
jgi:prepilin-type N-terminal cleavage/methylation domain-containing protein